MLLSETIRLRKMTNQDYSILSPDEAKFPIRTKVLSQSTLSSVRSRLPILVTLLMCQSISTLILKAFAKSLIRDHIVLSVFLTNRMIVGMGGNAGGQSAAVILQGLACGGINRGQIFKIFFREMKVGIFLAGCIGIVGYFRAMAQRFSSRDSSVIAVILFFVVVMSVAVGIVVPLGFSYLHHLCKTKYGEQVAMVISPGQVTFPTFQVITDLLGVLITVAVAIPLYASFEAPI